MKMSYSFRENLSSRIFQIVKLLRSSRWCSKLKPFVMSYTWRYCKANYIYYMHHRHSFPAKTFETPFFSGRRNYLLGCLRNNVINKFIHVKDISEAKIVLHIQLLNILKEVFKLTSVKIENSPTVAADILSKVQKAVIILYHNSCCIIMVGVCKSSL